MSWRWEECDCGLSPGGTITQPCPLAEQPSFEANGSPNLACATFVPADKGDAFREDPCLVVCRGFCKPGAGSPAGPRSTAGPVPHKPREDSLYPCSSWPPCLTSRPSLVLVFLTPLSFQYGKFCCVRGKETCPAGEHATFPFYHFLFSLSKSEMKDFFPHSFCSA